MKTHHGENLSQYFKEVSKYQLLSNSEETLLIQKLNGGRVRKEIIVPEGCRFHQDNAGVHFLGLDETSRLELLAAAERMWELGILDSYSYESNNFYLTPANGASIERARVYTEEALRKVTLDGLSSESNSALEKIWQSNLRLSISIAKRYPYGLSFEDRISEGNIGLRNGILHFDPEKTGKLSTYASWWIKQNIMNANISGGFPVRVSKEIFYNLRKVWKVVNNEGIPFREACRRIDLDSEQAIFLEQAYNTRGLYSLEDKLSFNGHEDTRATTLPSNSPTPQEIISIDEFREKIGECLMQMDERSAEVLTKYFYEGKTLDEIGGKRGITKERVRQLRDSALVELGKKLGLGYVEHISEELIKKSRSKHLKD